MEIPEILKNQLPKKGERMTIKKPVIIASKKMAKALIEHSKICSSCKEAIT